MTYEDLSSMEPIDLLKFLKLQVDAAINAVESGQLKQMSRSDACFIDGTLAFVGDFEIRARGPKIVKMGMYGMNLKQDLRTV